MVELGVFVRDPARLGHFDRAVFGVKASQSRPGTAFHQIGGRAPIPLSAPSFRRMNTKAPKVIWPAEQGFEKDIALVAPKRCARKASAGERVLPRGLAVVAKAPPVNCNSVGLLHVECVEEIVQPARAFVDHEKFVDVDVEHPFRRPDMRMFSHEFQRGAFDGKFRDRGVGTAVRMPAASSACKSSGE